MDSIRRIAKEVDIEPHGQAEGPATWRYRVVRRLRYLIRPSVLSLEQLIHPAHSTISTTQPIQSPDSTSLFPKFNLVKMQFINILLLASAAMSADAAPAGELHTRASNVKLAKVGNKWQAGWTGATTSQRYTCSNNGLLVSLLSWMSSAGRFVR